MRTGFSRLAQGAERRKALEHRGRQPGALANQDEARESLEPLDERVFVLERVPENGDFMAGELFPRIERAAGVLVVVEDCDLHFFFSLASRRRTDSKSTMPAATETLRLSTIPCIGMRTRKSQCSRVRRRMPSPSEPS